MSLRQRDHDHVNAGIWLDALPRMTNHFIERLNARAPELTRINRLHRAWSSAEAFIPPRSRDREIRDRLHDTRYYRVPPRVAGTDAPLVLVYADNQLVTLYLYEGARR